ncbi:MAG: membrane protein insertion efficiency factor YidD [Parcubacteria group bacterium]|nr:membrane protein insertion efficiency factor YidD [Parcubacteria group bacterium]
MKHLTYFPRYVVLKMIRLYQKTLSFDHGIPSKLYPKGYCRFYPTCSEYGYKVIESRGLIKGGILTTFRILRCNPFNAGGVDEPPGSRNHQ